MTVAEGRGVQIPTYFVDVIQVSSLESRPWSGDGDLHGLEVDGLGGVALGRVALVHPHGELVVRRELQFDYWSQYATDWTSISDIVSHLRRILHLYRVVMVIVNQGLVDLYVANSYKQSLTVNFGWYFWLIKFRYAEG